MLRIRNTIACPRCEAILRVSARVVSDGNEYEYYLCPSCRDVARRDPESQEWSLLGTPDPGVAELVGKLQAQAVEDWRTRSVRRAP